MEQRLQELKIKDKVDLKELEKRGFYLEGNTYKRDVGKGKCLSVCTINREIIKPKLGNWDFKIKDTVEEILFCMCLDGIVEQK